MSDESKRDENAHFENVDEMSEKHAEAIAQVRGLLTEGSEESDAIVYRFLRGHSYDVEKAAQYLNDTLKWRREHKLDEIRAVAKDMEQKDFPHFSKITRCYPHNVFHGYDKRGQPLSLERLGHTRPADLVRVISFEELLQYHLHHMENKAHMAAKLTAEQGQIIRTCKIMDLDGLSVSSLNRTGISYLRRIIRMSQDNYPEMLGNLYVINAPWVFQTVWKMVKPWLEPATLEKIKILGKDYQSVLKEVIDESNLPSWCGGTCNKCPNGCVVETDLDAGMTKVDVARQGTHEVDSTVDSNGVVVTWEFRTQSRDIAFSVQFREAGGSDWTTLKEEERVDSHKTNEYGSVTPPSPGVVRIRFSNEYSRWTGKTLLYRVEQVNADELEGGED